MILIAVNNGDYREEIRALFFEYLNWANEIAIRDYGLEVTEEEVNAAIDEDVKTIHRILPPNGHFYLAQVDGEFVGMGAIKKLDDKRGEIKRMYVKPQTRGLGVGKAILRQLIDDGRAFGFEKIVLDSPLFCTAAHQLYFDHQFVESGPYENNENPEEIYYFLKFMELDLQREGVGE